MLQRFLSFSIYLINGNSKSTSTLLELIRFVSSQKRNRIAMLSVKLFLVIRTLHLTYNVAEVGVLFLTYSLAKVFTNVSYIKFPTAFHFLRQVLQLEDLLRHLMEVPSVCSLFH